MSDRLSELIKLRNTLRRRRDKIRQQIAHYGATARPDLLMELEDVEEELTTTQKEWAQLLNLKCKVCVKGYYDDSQEPEVVNERYKVFFYRQKVTRKLICDKCAHILTFSVYNGSREYQEKNLRVQFIDESGKVVSVIGVSAIAGYIIGSNQEVILEFVKHVIDDFRKLLGHIVVDIAADSLLQ